MKHCSFYFVAVVLAVGLASSVSLASPRPEGESASSAPPPVAKPNTIPEALDRLGVLLSRHVADGRMNYKKVATSPQTSAEFKAVMDGLAVLDPAKLKPEEQLPFWINFYNACVIEQVLAKYPMASVNKVSGFFTESRCRIANSRKSLDSIEKQTVLGSFKEYRAHFALVCGAVGCPPLSAELYTSAKLNEQLEARAAAFINGPGVSIRPMQEGGGFKLSKIFEWYAADFQKLAPDGQFPRVYLQRYATDSYRMTALRDHQILGYLEYDWALNEPKEPKKP